MRSRTWSTTVGVAALTIGLLGGCTEKDGRTYPNVTDLARAQKVWADPWMAPSEATTVSPNGPAPGVQRDVAGRTYATSASPRAVVSTEVRAALTTGWQLVGAECSPDEQGVEGQTTAYLTQGTSADDARTAVVRASVTSSSAKVTEVGIRASVPHHLDGARPEPATQALAATCLVTGPPDGPSPTAMLPAEPDDVTLAGDRVEPPTWSDDDTAAVDAAVAALVADTGLKALELAVIAPPRGKDGEARKAAGSEATPKLLRAGLAETVTSLTSRGWTLTYAGCIGPGAPNVAELSRPAAERNAVLRLSEVASSSAGPSLAASVVVSTPGFSPPAPAAIADPCFALSPTPTAFSHKGILTLGPTRMFPLQR